VKILVIDIGGQNVKVLLSGRRKALKIPSGPHLTPREMVRRVREETAGWKYDVISIGYPGRVIRGRITVEPWNLGQGWVGFNFRRAFRKPVRVINDAAMQALGSYRGRRMLFLGLGTGLGNCMIRDGTLIPMELGHLPYLDKTYEDYVGEAGMLRLGKPKWRHHVAKVIDLFFDAFEIDYVVLGGGNSKRLKKLPPRTRLGSNANAFKGGFRLWERGTTARNA
jgi:polyphosphate glucokinase